MAFDALMLTCPKCTFNNSYLSPFMITYNSMLHPSACIFKDIGVVEVLLLFLLLQVKDKCFKQEHHQGEDT